MPKPKPITVGAFGVGGSTAGWGSRGPGIGATLRYSALDAYLLTDVGAEQMAELQQYVSNAYDVVHYPHPTSPGGVAVLVRRERLTLVHKACLPFWAKGALPQCWMCAAIAFVRDRATGTRLVIASTHQHSRNVQPEKALLDYLNVARRGGSIDGVSQMAFGAADVAIWGGPASRPGEGVMPKGYLTPAAEAGSAGRTGSKGVFVFASEAGGTAVVRRPESPERPPAPLSPPGPKPRTCARREQSCLNGPRPRQARTAATRAFCAGAARPLPATGLPPSSMLADAVAVHMPPRTEPAAAPEQAEPVASAAAAPPGAARRFERSPLFHALGDTAPLVVPNHPPRASTLFAVVPMVGA